MAIGLNSDTNSRVSINDNQEIDLITNSQPRFRIENTGQIKAVYESQVGTDYNTTLHNGYLCRAWVNFNGTGAVSIRASGNVSSITDNNTGDYTINFTIAMADANYSIGGICGNTIRNNWSGIVTHPEINTNNFRFNTNFAQGSGFGYYDFDNVLIQVFR